VTTHRVERRLWLLVAGISFLILSSEAYFTWYVTTIDVSGPSMPGSFQLLQLLAVVLGAWVVATMTTFGAAPARSLLRFGLDVFGGMIVLAAVCYGRWVLPWFQSVSGETWQGAAISALYPVVGLTIVAFMGVAMAAGRSYRWRSWERLITVSFLLYGAGLILTPIAYLQMKSQSNAQSSLWATAALGFGYYVLFMSIVYRATTRREDPRIEPWFFPRLGPRWFPTAYPIMLAAALPVLGVWALRMGEDPAGMPIALAAVCLAAVLVAGSWLRSNEAVLHRIAAYTDTVTGVYNYRYLRQRLASDLDYARALDTEIAIITIGVEGLRTVSNVAGPAEYQRVTATVAAAIQDEVRDDMTLCRSSIDSFVVIAGSLTAEEARHYAPRFIAAAAAGIEPLGVHVGFSAGVAAYPTHGGNVDELLTHSAAAQAASASAEDAEVVVYDPNLVLDEGSSSRMSVARTRSRRATARALAVAVDARDPETRRHSENVADLASALALMLDLPAERAQVLDLAAQMHDVGKIGVPDAVLRASGEISPEQRDLVEQHAVLGERILAAARLDEILPAVRHHHERWDGKGYPDGLSGTEIPLEARILTVCDAYESMTAPRSYGENLSVDEAVHEIELCSGTQFDPDIAAPFCRMISQIHGASARDRAGRSAGQPPGTSNLAGF
jgi:diguanylate cyclase (GGDEF)-like protein